MKDTDKEYFDRGYNEGYMTAVLETTSKVIKTLTMNFNGMLPADRTIAIAKFKLAAEQLLRKRNLIPSSYDVITGKAEAVELDFDIDV